MTIQEEKMFKKLYVASKDLLDEINTNRRIKKYNIINTKDGFHLMVATSILQNALYEIEHTLFKEAKWT